MKPVLGEEGLGRLLRLAHGPCLLGFDFDGTLAPIHASRDLASMRASTSRLLRGLCDRYPVAVLSGRSREDVASRLDGCAVRHVVGNHGLEPGGDLEAAAALAARVRAFLEESLAGLDGVDIEDKRFSLSVHYRRASDPAGVRGRVLDTLASMRVPFKVVPGKMVLNVVAEDADHKGDALIALMRREGVKAGLYVGDDVTDEDVFCLPAEAGVLTVRVGRGEGSSADWYLPGQAGIDRLLEVLLEARGAA